MNQTTRVFDVLLSLNAATPNVVFYNTRLHELALRGCGGVEAAVVKAANLLYI
jgi:hypothetical protein